MNRFKDVFKDELELIEDKEFREFVIHFGNSQALDYFYTIPSSTSGKYHPQDELGEGGLILHCKRVCQFALEFARMKDMESAERDLLIAAALLHDLYRCGDGSELKSDERHPIYIYNALIQGLPDWPIELQDFLSVLSVVCLLHTGRWSHPEVYEIVEKEVGAGLTEKVEDLSRVFHWCDCLAASRNIHESMGGDSYNKGIIDGVKLVGRRLDQILEEHAR